MIQDDKRTGIFNKSYDTRSISVPFPVVVNPFFSAGFFDPKSKTIWILITILEGKGVESFHFGLF